MGEWETESEVFLHFLGPACSYGIAQRLFTGANEAAVPLLKATTAQSKSLKLAILPEPWIG